MKGLVLNNLYSAEKSIKLKAVLGIAVVVILLVTKETIALRMAVFLPFFLLPIHAFEVLKHDVKSGWDKYELTLPVTRSKIIGSKYVTFLLLLTASLFIAALPFVIAHLFFYPTLNALFFNYLLRGIGIIVCLAAATFVLTYKLGTEKADTIVMYSAGFTGTVFFGLSFLLPMVVGTGKGFDEIFSSVFCILAVLLFIGSYVISNVLYRNKEL